LKNITQGRAAQQTVNGHQVTNLLITPVSDDEVRVTHDMLVLEVNEKPGLVATGRYNNSKVVRTSRWKFSTHPRH
jgi:hypothetical protein